MPSIAQASISSSTNRSYTFTFRRFKAWCEIYKLSALPASVTTIAIYLSYLIQKQVSKSVFVNAFYAIKWQHKLNLFNDIFSEPFLKLILEGGERLLSKPLVKKQPITVDILRRVVSEYGKEDNLSNLRICCLMLLGYAGFLRFNELSNIKACNLKLSASHVEIVVEKSKPDVYRQGDTVVIARTRNITCPVNMLERYMKLANIELGSDEFIFRAISY